MPLEVSPLSSRTGGRRGSRLARCARWLGLDRNPLRRGTDRIETAICLAVLILLVTAVPGAAIAAGQWADQVATRQVRAEYASHHQVSAVLLTQAPGTKTSGASSSKPEVPVLARWVPPGLPEWSGQVLALEGGPTGSTVRIWVDARGAVTDAPAERRDVISDVCIAVLLTCIAAPAALFGLAALARACSTVARLTAWDAEWPSIGPRWTGHRT